MKLDVNIIENNLYARICEGFSEFAEKKFHRYRTVLAFLRTTDVEKIVTATTLEVYKQYEDFCASNGYEKLEHTVFSKTVCECGFTTKHKQQYKPVKKKLIYFVMC